MLFCFPTFEILSYDDEGWLIRAKVYGEGVDIWMEIYAYLIEKRYKKRPAECTCIIRAPWRENHWSSSSGTGRMRTARSLTLQRQCERSRRKISMNACRMHIPASSATCVISAKEIFLRRAP